MPCNICGSPKTFEEFLASLIKKDSVGNYGLVINQITVDDCRALVSAVQCGEPVDLGALIQQMCTLDSCGNPTLNIFVDSVN